VAGVAREQIRCSVAIHESSDAAEAQRFWQDATGLPAEQFRRPTLKRHNPKTNRMNTGNDYHGCLVIHVLQGMELYRQIEGWACAVTETKAS
jgi:hypothetical protein